MLHPNKPSLSHTLLRPVLVFCQQCSQVFQAIGSAEYWYTIPELDTNHGGSVSYGRKCFTASFNCCSKWLRNINHITSSAMNMIGQKIGPLIAVSYVLNSTSFVCMSNVDLYSCQGCVGEKPHPLHCLSGGRGGRDHRSMNFSRQGLREETHLNMHLH